MGVAAGMTIGHPCTACKATMEACDATIRRAGHGCCPSCFDSDTHGLLDKFRVIDVHDQQQQIENLNRLMAQTVIARGEHARAIRKVQADVDTLVATVARIEGSLERVDEGEKRRLLTEVMAEVRAEVKRLPERVKELEDVAVALEKHLKLTRRPKERR